jgi:hypothetical protein
MLRLTKALLLATLSVITVQGQKAYAEAIPLTIDIITPFQQFGIPQHQVGADGNIRFLWDYFSPSGYQGSALWILNPQGQVVASSNVLIPGTIGTGISTFITGNHAIHVAPIGNTTVVFPFVVTPASGTTPATVDGFSTWTYNAQGQLIAFGGPYGPFGNALLENLEFKNGTLIAQWANGGSALGPVSVWSLDEFGNIRSSGGPFGPFGSSVELAGVDVSQINNSPVQIWHFLTVSSTGTAAGENVWTVNSTGNIIASASYGPF